jgi:hypothetical protein
MEVLTNTQVSNFTKPLILKRKYLFFAPQASRSRAIKSRAAVFLIQNTFRPPAYAVSAPLRLRGEIVFLIRDHLRKSAVNSS